MLLYEFDEGEDAWVVPLPHARKVLPTEEAAWLYCAERNGLALPKGPRASSRNEARRKFAREALLAGRNPWSEEIPDITAEIVDVSVLEGSARESIQAIRELEPNKQQRALLAAEERSGKNRKSVLAALGVV